MVPQPTGAGEWHSYVVGPRGSPASHRPGGPTTALGGAQRAADKARAHPPSPSQVLSGKRGLLYLSPALTCPQTTWAPGASLQPRASMGPGPLRAGSGPGPAGRPRVGGAGAACGAAQPQAQLRGHSVALPSRLQTRGLTVTRDTGQLYRNEHRERVLQVSPPDSPDPACTGPQELAGSWVKAGEGQE